MQLAQGAQSTIIDGLTQWFHVHGTGPLVIAHPGGPGLDWHYLRMEEAEKHLAILYVEPIGTGGSTHLDDPSGYTYSRYARQVEGLADHLGLDKITLLGHSSGGFVAQRFALEHPDRLSALVLYDTSAVVNADYYGDVLAAVAAFPAKHLGHDGAVHDAMEAWASQGDVVTDQDFSEIARRVFPLYFRDFWAQEDRLSALQSEVRGWIAPQRAGGLVDDLEELPGVTQPTLIIVGRHDFICGPRWSEKMHTALPHSELVVLEGAGHFGHIETETEFTEEFVGFVRNLG
jgi:proline iminopeptidase